MYSHSHDELFDEVTMRLLQLAARRLARSRAFRGCDPNDLAQELAAMLLERVPKFNPTKGRWRAFAATVIRNCAEKLRRQKTAIKRDDSGTVSLSAPINGGNHCPTELAASITDRHYDARRGRQPRTPEMLSQMQNDVDSALSVLPFKQRWLAELLKNKKKADISRQFCMPRTTLNDEVRRLRHILQRTGLQFYLEASPSSRAASGYLKDREENS